LQFFFHIREKNTFLFQYGTVLKKITMLEPVRNKATQSGILWSGYQLRWRMSECRVSYLQMPAMSGATNLTALSFNPLSSCPFAYAPGGLARRTPFQMSIRTPVVAYKVATKLPYCPQWFMPCTVQYTVLYCTVLYCTVLYWGDIFRIEKPRV
jgi:hypothetical protein